MDFDVAIIGGGPGGSTTGTLLRKYNSELRVGILERERFPRDHVGESQLPGTCAVLAEMGVWDKVEAANFPIKAGATYRWGKSRELWDFEFYPRSQFVDEARPARYEGQRKATAFQVDRAIYDDLLLRHAEEMGCEVHEETRVTKVVRDGDRVSHLELEGGETATARYYIDASGHSGILRRAMGVQTDCPTSLQNIAIWEYWENAEWAVEIGVGATFVQVLSVDFGWLWFIPLGPTRTSIGLVTPASYFKQRGIRPADLYAEAIQQEPRVRELTKNATREGKLQTTKDWSFVSERHAGENWFLVGEASGFADPILAAGLTMTHVSGREAACTILEMDRTPGKVQWLRDQYSLRQSQRVRNHMRFADYWYSANGVFQDLQAFTAEVARDSGLDLAPDKAWAWLAQGGFIGEDLSIGTGTFTLNGIKALSDVLHETEVPAPLAQNNTFVLDLDGASWSDRARYVEGRVVTTPSFIRGDRILPVDGVFEPLVNILQRESRVEGILEAIRGLASRFEDPKMRSNVMVTAFSALEALVLDGWVKASNDPSRPLMNLEPEYHAIHWNRD